MIIRFVLLILTAGQYLFAEIDAAAGHMVEALPPRDIGKEVYYKYCTVCHGSNMQKVDSASFGPKLLQRYSISDLIGKLNKGCKSKGGDSFESLKVYESVKVIRYISKESRFR